MKKIFSILLILTFIYPLAFSLAQYQVPEELKNGEEAIRLNCPWDFYWGKFIAPDDFESQPDFEIKIPSVWNEYNLKEEDKEIAKKGYGSATYRIKITNLKPQTSYSFMAFALSYTAYEIFADNTLIYQSGKPNEDWEKTVPHQKFDYATFTSNDDGSKILTFHISNNVYRKDGLKKSVVLKETSQIKEDFTKNVSNYCILSGILLAIIVYSILLFTLKKQKTNIYLALFAATILSRIVAEIFPLIKYFFPDFSYSILFKIEFFS
ncbi:MAG: 7TM-DISM domain-containing protein, partial [Treponema sp.]|nr:7TM-DISM domain-containing protein [Treponema sp.]